MPEDFQRRVVVELDPGLDTERHQLLRLDIGEEEVRSPALVRRNRHRAENVSGATRLHKPQAPIPRTDVAFGGSATDSFEELATVPEQRSFVGS